MGLFGRSGRDDAGRPSRRQIPELNPAFFEEIQRSLQAQGTTESVPDIADGVANAIENIAHRLFEGWNEPWGTKRFDKAFGGRSRGRLETADKMIDWMVEYEVTSQEVLETTLARLAEVMAKPPPA